MTRRRARLLVVDDDPMVADALTLTLEADGFEVWTATSVKAALDTVADTAVQAAIVDLNLPDGDGIALTRELKRRDPTVEVIILTGYGSMRRAMEATKGAGAFHVLDKPFDPEEVLALIGSALDHRRLASENATLRRRLGEREVSAEILGRAGVMQRLLDTVTAVAESDVSVLIIGETGTGKELIANAVHERSRRRAGPFVKVNCAALPKDLIESELFGHAKGAFTGATTDKPGLVEEASGGSLLLDEITEMPIDLQAKLLRVLEERTMRRVGASRAEPVDFRLISSTNRDPDDAIHQGLLRPDLYFRINTLTLAVPPLRERREDVPVLIDAFFERYRARHARAVERISPDAYRALLAHAWPGNVRELEHAIERAVLLARGAEVTVDDLPASIQVPRGGETGQPVPVGESSPDALAQLERSAILRALEATDWNKRAAAALLGIRRPGLYSKMRRHGISPQRPRQAAPRA
jgi:DNA-binding NtrC family response regulator